MTNKLKKTLLDACFELSVASVIARQRNLPIKKELSTAKEAVYEAIEALNKKEVKK